MKFTLKNFLRAHNAKDRIQSLTGKHFHWVATRFATRAVTLGLTVMIFSIPAFVPAVVVLTADGSLVTAEQPQATIHNTRPSRLHPVHYSPSGEDHSAETISLVAEEELNDYFDSGRYHLDQTDHVSPEDGEVINDYLYLDKEIQHTETNPTGIHTQETIARSMDPIINTGAKAGAKITYPYPAGAMAVTLYKDGKQILKGQAADIGGTVYVPVQRFADLFGYFRTVYTEATEQVVITGTNLSITVKVGDPYITVNERIFYTGKKVLSLGGWIFVPLTSMCKALGAKVTIRSGYYDAFITSGDPTGVAWASEFYNSNDLYWLSRIISAEAKGEPFAGQIAVGNVVLNRMRSNQFPNTVKEVIFDTTYGTQFSPVASGTIYNTPTVSAVRAAKICLEGYSLSNKIIYFYNPSIATSSWIGRMRPYIMTIGNHKFYG